MNEKYGCLIIRQQILHNEHNYCANQCCNLLDIFILFLYLPRFRVLFISHINQKLVRTWGAYIDRVLDALVKFEEH